MEKFWHDLSKEEQQKFFDDNGEMDLEEFKMIFKQPDWCNYPSALDGGIMGCMGLWFGYCHGEEYCNGCDENSRRK